MAIARVFHSWGIGPATEESRKRSEEYNAKCRQAEGCEGLVNMADPAIGEGLSISRWRDQAAAQAFNATSEQMRSEGTRSNPGFKTVGPHVYTEVTALL